MVSHGKNENLENFFCPFGVQKTDHFWKKQLFGFFSKSLKIIYSKFLRAFVFWRRIFPRGHTRHSLLKKAKQSFGDNFWSFLVMGYLSSEFHAILKMDAVVSHYLFLVLCLGRYICFGSFCLFLKIYWDKIVFYKKIKFDFVKTILAKLRMYHFPLKSFGHFPNVLPSFWSPALQLGLLVQLWFVRCGRISPQLKNLSFLLITVGKIKEASQAKIFVILPIFIPKIAQNCKGK